MRYFISILCLFLFFRSSYANDSLKVSKIDFSGYLTGMQSITKIPKSNFNDKEWLYESLLHNRLNFYWYPNENITATVQLRNRYIYGDNVKLNPAYKENIGKDNGFVPLTTSVSGSSYILTSTIDRLWAKFILGNFEIVAGRQRINWGQTFVWNPNDIFNTYSYFDFDYEERPGSDAIRLQYYTGVASSAEVAIKMDSAKNVTAAGLYKFNVRNYDIQILGGYYNSEDYIVGTGWSGGIWNFGFRGEFTYLYPQKEFNDTSGLIFTSLSCEYMFNNSAMLSFEFFYSESFLDLQFIDTTIFSTNPLSGSQSDQNFAFFNTVSLSIKDVAMSKFSFFGQFSYPLTPLINAGIGAMYLPSIDGGFIGPNLSYSLKNNLEISFFAQIFNGKFPDYSNMNLIVQQILANQQPNYNLLGLKRQTYSSGYFRLKWNF